ncbi:MAG: TonB-dependent receptor [Acidobacteriota bacterium]
MQSRFLNLFLCLSAAAAMAVAQTAGGTITGTVTDQTGAVISGVTVSAKQLATGTTVVGVSSDTGNYTIPQLRVGEYEVAIEHTGFKAARRQGVTLDASQTLRLDFSLEVGSTTDSVTVTAETTLLQTESGQLVTNLKPSQIQNLPLLPVSTGFIRDPFALSNTIPGVLQTFVGTRINGLGQSTIQYRLEGEVLGQQGFAGITTRTQPSPDAIEEVAVLTSNIPVEFGSASGGVYNISIKSGTNKLHGTVYDYAINEVLNAADPANHVRNRIRRHDYGFNIGGPVKIPFLYNGENKSFFFFNWEQYRDVQKGLATTIPTVPTDAYRKGDFSGLFAVTNNANLSRGAATLSNGAAVGVHDYIDAIGNTIKLGSIYDPTSIRTVTCSASPAADCQAGTSIRVRTAFPGNLVPASYQDPVSAKVLSKYIPLPNVNSLINNYQVIVPSTRFTDSPAIKLDQNLGSKVRLSFTYTSNKTTAATQTLGNLAEGFVEPVTANTGTYEKGPSYRVNLDYTVRPTINYHLGLGYTIFEFETHGLTTSYDAFTDIGLRGSTANKTFPQFNLTPQTAPATGGLYRLGTAGLNRQLERRPSISQTVTWVNGNHTVKAGADFRQDMLPNQGFAGTNGSYGFSATGISWNPSLNGVSGLQGNTNVGFQFANFLMGSVNNVSLSVPLAYRRSKQQWGAFVQDTWRVRRNLTIDAGIRWDYGTYTKEDWGRLGALSLTEPNTSASGHPGGLIYEATCKCQFAQNYPFAIGPRFGVAYTLNPKTVIRAGIGLAYGSTPVVSGAAQGTETSASVPVGEDAFKLKDGIPTSIAPAWPVYLSGRGLTVGSVGGAPALIDPNAGRPDRTVQWNVSLQREIARDFVVEASYVGNRGVWQQAGGFQDFNAVGVQQLAKYNFTVGNLTDANILTTGFLGTQSAATLAAKGLGLPYGNFQSSAQSVLQSIKPFPQYSTGISPAGPLGRSWYDSLQLTATKRYSHGLELTANYTFSKNLSWTSVPDVFNPVNGKDIFGGNPPQVLRIAFSYQTPRASASLPVLGSRWVASALKDWQVAASMFYQTGTYLGRPPSTGTTPISRWLGRGPGSSQLKQNADGSYMNPWAVNWKDLDGNVHAEPLDINCHCFDPEKTLVLNPNAWTNIPDGQWGAQTALLPFFRNARRPSENANFARNFRLGKDGRFTLQARVEFVNIFNRKFVPTPSIPATSTAPGLSADGRYISGFGTFGNLRNANSLGAARSGQFIARLSF